MADYADPENTLVIETTQGNVVIAMRPDLAPNHVAHIKKLAREGFYDGIVFHRVIEGFMAQTGCPQGRGTGGSKYPDLKQEFNAEPHVRGTASMARAQNPDSANSQFFICFGDAPFLNKQYTVWGKVIEGMDNVDKIKRGEPVINPDKMVSVKVAADIAALGQVWLALVASLALAAPAAASGGIWCEGEGVSLELATGRLPVLQVIGARADAGDQAWSTGPERGDGTPFVVGQAFAGDDGVMVDFVDPNFEAILVSLRLAYEADREQEWPLSGTATFGDATYPVRCGAD